MPGGHQERRAYPTDLRQRVVAAHDGTRDQIAARFSVSISWVCKVLGQRRDTGPIDPKPRGGGRAPAFDGAAAVRLRAADNDAASEELARSAGVACSAPAVFRALNRMGVTQKKSKRAAGWDRPELKAEREAWRRGSAAVDPSRLMFVDESGAGTAWTAHTDAPPAACGPTARCRTGIGRSRP